MAEPSLISEHRALRVEGHAYPAGLSAEELNLERQRIALLAANGTEDVAMNTVNRDALARLVCDLQAIKPAEFPMQPSEADVDAVDLMVCRVGEAITRWGQTVGEHTAYSTLCSPPTADAGECAVEDLRFSLSEAKEWAVQRMEAAE